jgi:hypothetical protein
MLSGGYSRRVQVLAEDAAHWSISATEVDAAHVGSDGPYFPILIRSSCSDACSFAGFTVTDILHFMITKQGSFVSKCAYIPTQMFIMTWTGI